MDVRTAIVSGASRGIGRAIAVQLAADGCNVVVNYSRDSDGADETTAAVEAHGREALPLQADLGARNGAATLVDAAMSRWGRVDIAVNNAGMSSNETLIADTPEADWQQMLELNLNGAYRMVRAVVPVMRKQKSGHIVNLSSNVTQRMPASFGPYTVSKAALEALTRILAKEEGPHGIRVNAIAPGPIRTGMLAALMDNMGPERAQAFVDSVPLGRVGEPAEIANMVAMLVSDTASFVTGQVIFVNGGGPGG